IGQSDNMFTPLQMANYIATIANGGTRYAPHLVKEIIKHDGSETLVSFEPKVLNTIEIAPENLKFVQEGMRSVVTEGSAKVNFADAKYEAAGKTGTAQTRRDKTPHSWFVSYAPFDEPKLAIAVIVEYGGVNSLGKYVSKVARNMYDAYFFSSNEEVPISNNTLIN
ncbi:MAG: penicillin-binding protein 2, partial [Clostridia bacterium]|nr:penicillin-binding protein 2 [Clostridia bacterium]